MDLLTPKFQVSIMTDMIFSFFPPSLSPPWGSRVTNRSSVAPTYGKRRRLGGLSTDQEDLWVRFPVATGSSHTKDVENGSGPSLHGTHDEVGTTEHMGL